MKFVPNWYSKLQEHNQRKTPLLHVSFKMPKKGVTGTEGYLKSAQFVRL